MQGCKALQVPVKLPSLDLPFSPLPPQDPYLHLYPLVGQDQHRPRPHHFASQPVTPATCANRTPSRNFETTRLKESLTNCTDLLEKKSKWQRNLEILGKLQKLQKLLQSFLQSSETRTGKIYEIRFANCMYIYISIDRNVQWSISSYVIIWDVAHRVLFAISSLVQFWRLDLSSCWRSPPGHQCGTTADATVSQGPRRPFIFQLKT